MKTARRMAALAATLAVLAGCTGYSHRFPMPPGAENVKTVAIHIFKNKTLYTDVEFEFTTAFQREICAKTPLTIAPRGTADSVITGSVDAYEKVVLREFETDEVARYSIVLTVSYEFQRLPAEGEPEEVITSARRLRRSAEYEVRSNITEADARAEAVRKIARDVVSHMFEKW